MTDKLDEIDRRLLDIIQAEFPLVSRPYAALAEKLGISEAEALKRVNSMRETGVIRRLGANFQSAKIGYVSTLCAASVPASRLEAYIKRVNSEPGVTHNYERDNVYNIWFTLISPSRKVEAETIAAISAETGVKILNLPAARLYKIRVNFPMSD